MDSLFKKSLSMMLQYQLWWCECCWMLMLMMLESTIAIESKRNHQFKAILFTYNVHEWIFQYPWSSMVAIVGNDDYDIDHLHWYLSVRSEICMNQNLDFNHGNGDLFERWCNWSEFKCMYEDSQSINHWTQKVSWPMRMRMSVWRFSWEKKKLIWKHFLYFNLFHLNT